MQKIFQKILKKLEIFFSISNKFSIIFQKYAKNFPKNLKKKV